MSSKRSTSRILFYYFKVNSWLEGQTLNELLAFISSDLPASMQRWQCRIHNGTPKTFIWSIMWKKLLFLDVLNFSNNSNTFSCSRNIHMYFILDQKALKGTIVNWTLSSLSLEIALTAPWNMFKPLLFRIKQKFCWVEIYNAHWVGNFWILSRSVIDKLFNLLGGGERV